MRWAFAHGIVDLSAKKHSSHFAVSHTSVEQLEEFNMDLLGRGMQRLAPKLWGLLDKLLFAGKKSKKVVIFSIIMQTANQKSNTFQSIFGIFLQSTHAPQKVIETLSRMGICVSIDSINTAITSLSKEAHHGISALGRTLLASYAYDNFDVDLKSTVHTVDKSEDTLKHLTAGLLFPLQHGTTLDNLHCSKALWERSLLNPQDRLGHLESVEMIPVAKTKILASRAMDISNSTVAGNINSVLELLKQGDIEDPAECDPLQGLDVSEDRRAIENTPWNRLQHIIFIPGLFHLKMASADAIWRTFLQHFLARLDENALMRDVGILRPKETGIYGSKPGFRRMHQLITYSGICRRLDCWRVEVKKMSSEPLFDDILAMADVIAKEYVADHRLQRMRSKDVTQRDGEYENALLLNKYMLLYKELSYAMNIGDIGRVETCIVAWILIFKATGKHKYVTHMSDFLSNVHFVYPDGLQRAVRYHILVNPSGKAGSFRAIDWCMESNNLYTKVIHGGKGPNRTIDRIILESPLVQVYRNLQRVFEENFLHLHLTTRHTIVDMTRTFNELCRYIAQHSPHELVLGRKSKHSIPDLYSKGLELIDKQCLDAGIEEGGTLEEHPTLEDVAVELGL
ncbi:uncharacterized protein HD556DRAFT_1431369 [Suillus plorans]|uniref:DUF6589 domain-containing protein n=1 Tax=Suillus plorans TaxID=116603 RepID=A0A9P7AXB6_9AGAM|nr:uncharacterized protein HD556DRAFT_1431369 [Suillus plorans]KAG1796230.1 hypothetical protein HD556DRAFT_1431369 [Suillus plorans]